MLKLLGFLLDNGVTSIGADPRSVNHLWTVSHLEEDHVPLMARMVDAGVSLDISHAHSAVFLPLISPMKHNLQLILAKSDEVVQIPESIRLVCCKNATELRQALDEKRVSPNEIIHNTPLLEWAFGWPEGIEILLEFGADPDYRFESLLYPGIEYHRSAVLLLQAGCRFSKYELNRTLYYDDTGERMQLLIKTLTTRRENLRRLAEASLPSTMIPKGKVLDGPECLEVYNCLLARNISPPTLDNLCMSSDGATVYHGLERRECAEALYNAGFHDTDTLDLKGHSPLSYLADHYTITPNKLMKLIDWHISKGGDLSRKLPWTNESVGHGLAVKIIKCCLWLAYDLECHGLNHSDHAGAIKTILQYLGRVGSAVFMPAIIPDGCSCPCSPGGCTAISAISLA
ncbi:hypothetical protein ASPZODRAFT_674970 [Penicilliopsis zonata CBS 506.65]|uniref:Uncharacterized protein n=1 Tax=Penicilliopsis zonata CBS 506.65 TaxID=1073090 RepID=A0A1L9SCX6_9EURO|nr:hypothetical protein ASPZODRAFT_674970 [Penicilliopsis zonata CBS 506.65]OJJ45075.1 hypothetical protein ASPZODRAFT_674970 [Penicilliopsis zonata CBS 506.65]